MQRLRTRNPIYPNLLSPNPQSSSDRLPSPATLIPSLLQCLNLHCHQHYSTEIISIANSKSHFSNQVPKKPSFRNLILPKQSLCTSTSDPSSSSKSVGSTHSRKSQPIDTGSSNRKPISLWPGMHHSPATQPDESAHQSKAGESEQRATDRQAEEEGKNLGTCRTSPVITLGAAIIVAASFRIFAGFIVSAAVRIMALGLVVDIAAFVEGLRVDLDLAWLRRISGTIRHG